MSEIDESTSEFDPSLVEILLKTVGPSRPSRLKVPSRIKVSDLRRFVAANEHLPIESLKLVLKGSALNDSKNGEDVSIQLANGDLMWQVFRKNSLNQHNSEDLENCLIVAVRPKAPPKHIRSEDDDDDEDEDDLKFQLPESSSRWKWRLFCILHDKLKLPDIVLIALFSISLKAWVFISLWFVLAPIAHRLDLGPLYIIGTGFFIIFWNLGRRQTGELSAYSIFNEDFRELPGTLNAERLDRDLRTGQL